jgi:hypothetical protein
MPRVTACWEEQPRVEMVWREPFAEMVVHWQQCAEMAYQPPFLEMVQQSPWVLRWPHFAGTRGWRQSPETVGWQQFVLGPRQTGPMPEWLSPPGSREGTYPNRPSRPA